jgi:hypothetical protein
VAGLCGERADGGIALIKRLGRLVTGVLGILLAVPSGFICIATAAELRRPGAAFGTELFVALFYLAVTLAGVAMIRFAWPGMLGRLPARMAAAASNRALLYNPLVQAAALYVISALLFTITGKAAIMVALVAACLYAIGSPASIALRPRWWLNAVLSTVAGIVLVAALGGTAEPLSRQRIGEDAMVLLFPITIFPLALLGSLGLHLVLNRETRRTGAP